MDLARLGGVASAENLAQDLVGTGVNCIALQLSNINGLFESQILGSNRENLRKLRRVDIKIRPIYHARINGHLAL